MIRVALPALIVMTAVAAFVGAAGWNASGEPRLTIKLTERELELPYRTGLPGDDPGLQLRIAYEGRHDPLDARNWLPETRLRELGFALHVPPGAPQAADAYDHVPSRLAWIALEYDGPLARAEARRRELSADPTDPRPSARLRSRLVPVDAAVEFETLRARYPSGHLIVRGVIGIVYLPPGAGGPLIYGTLRDLVPATVAVPQAFRPLLAGMTNAAASDVTEPRFAAEIAVGRLGIPYVRSVQP
jgi:hypothetical protein